MKKKKCCRPCARVCARVCARACVRARVRAVPCVLCRACCAQVCSPSRNSYMTGRRPDRTRVWNFLDDFRVARNDSTGEAGVPGNGASWTSLPGYFLRNGWVGGWVGGWVRRGGND